MNTRMIVSWLRACGVSSLLLCLLPCAPAWSQGVTNGRLSGFNGLPFERDPGVETAGWHLNTNSNGLQDFGEFAVDCGGSGASFCDVTQAPLAVTGVVDTGVDRIIGGVKYTCILRTGTLNGKTFKILFLDPDVHRDAPRANMAAVYYHATRTQSNLHTEGQDLDPPSGFFLSQGVAIGLVVDETGDHPYVRTASNGYYLMRYFRDVMEREKVIVFGGSYGAVGLMQCILQPKDFDGFLIGGGSYLSTAFSLWHAMYRNMERAQGRPRTLYPRFSVDPDQLLVLFNQLGKTIHNYDIFSEEGLKQLEVPGIIYFGDSDAHMFPNRDIDIINTRLANLGINYVQVQLIEDAGHGGRSPARCSNTPPPPFEPMLLTLMDGFTGPAHPDSSLPATPTPHPTFLPFLNEEKTEGTAVGYGDFLVPKWRNNVPMEVGQFLDSAAIRTDGAGETAVYSGDRWGNVSKHILTEPVAGTFTLTEVWRRFAGMEIDTVVVDDLDDDGDFEVVVAHVRGHSVLEAATGAVVRMEPGFSVQALAVGDVIQANPGKEIIASVGFTVAIWDAATGNLLHTQDIGVVTQFRIETAPPGDPYAGEPETFMASPRGHVYRMRFETTPTNGPYKMVAKEISPYLEMSVRDIAFVDDGSGGRRLIAAGTHHRDNIPVIHELTPDAALIARSFGGFSAAVCVRPVGANRVWIGEGNRILEYDLSQPNPVGTTLYSGANQFLRGDLAASVLGVETIVFRRDHTIEVLDSALNTSPIFQRLARPSSTAVDAFETAGGSWEISILTHPRNIGTQGSDWEIETFDARTGSLLNRIAKPYKNALLDLPHWDLPRILDRHAEPLVPESFETFRHAGFSYQGPDPQNPGSLTTHFVSTDNGWTNDYLQLDDYAFWALTIAPDLCLKSSWKEETQDTRDPIPVPDGGYDPLNVNPFGSFGQFWSEDPWPDSIDYLSMTGGIFPIGTQAENAGVIVGSPSGKLHFWNPSQAFMHPLQRNDLGRQIMALDQEDVDGDPNMFTDYVYAGSVFPDEDGMTFHVLDQNFNTLDSVHAGHVVGLTAAGDLDGDPATREIVLGCANGDLIVYAFHMGTETLSKLHQRNVGALMAGARDSIYVIREPNQPTLVSCSVDGGNIVFEVDPTATP